MDNLKDKKEETGKDKPVIIYVNSTEETWNENHITFEQLVALAFNNPPNNGIQEYVVKYSRAEGNKSGTLVTGEKVKVKSEMVFDVTATNKS